MYIYLYIFILHIYIYIHTYTDNILYIIYYIMNKGRGEMH